MLTLDELKKLAVKELDEEVQKAKIDLMKLRLAVSFRQSKETSKLKDLRKYIARIKTLKCFMKMERIPETPKSPVTK